MARNIQLSDLLRQLKLDLGMDPNPAVNQANNTMLTHGLQSAQRDLWRNFVWPYLVVHRYVVCQEGQIRYPFPADLDIERVQAVEFRYASTFLPLAYGIDWQELSAIERNQRQFPVLKYGWLEDEVSGLPNIQIWPTPPGDGHLYDPNNQTPFAEVPLPNQEPDGDNYLRISGVRQLRPFTESQHVCDIDGDLIVAYAASELSPQYAPKRAPLLIQKAGSMLQQLRGNYTQTRAFRINGGGPVTGLEIWKAARDYRNRYAPQ